MSNKKTIIAIVAAVIVAAICLCAYVWHEQKERIGYDLSSVEIEGLLETDGSLRVTDRRTMTIDDESQVIRWKILDTTNLSRVSISSVRVVFKANDDAEELEQKQLAKVYADSSWRSGIDKCEYEEASFAYDTTSNDFYIFIPEGDSFTGEVFVETSYTIDNAVTRYDDVAELYWDYMPAQRAQNVEVTARVLLPNDSFENGSNTLAWGHGPKGEVTPLEVPGYEFASTSDLNVASRAHVVCPSSWLVNVKNSDAINSGGARLEYAKQEEAAWNDTSNVITSNSLKVSMMVVVACAILLAVDFAIYARRTKQYRMLLGDGGVVRGEYAKGGLLDAQLKFDAREMRLQNYYFASALVAVLLAAICIALLSSAVGAAACAVLAATLVVLGNYTPYIHMSIHDRIEKKF